MVALRVGAAEVVPPQVQWQNNKAVPPELVDGSAPDHIAACAQAYSKPCVQEIRYYHQPPAYQEAMCRAPYIPQYLPQSGVCIETYALGYPDSGWNYYVYSAYWIYDVIPVTCPANSTKGSDCSCNEGYTADGTTNQCVPMIEVPKASAPPPPECEVCKGNPILPLRGVKREVVDTGLAIGNTTLQFTYDNTGRIPKVWANPPVDQASKAPRHGPLGSAMWFGNLHRSVAPMRSGDSASPRLPNPMVFDRGTGVSKTMTSTGGAAPEAEPGNGDRFVTLVDGSILYTDSTNNVQETYTSAGRLTAMAWPDRTRIDFSYSDASTPTSVAPFPGLLIQAIDNRGHSVSFAYTAGPDSSARLGTITDAGGQVTTLVFDGQDNLAGIAWPDGTTKTLLYERTDLPWALTGVTDERGVRYSTFGYDAEGRAISTEHANGVDRYTVSYATPPSVRVTEQRDGGYLARSYDWIAPQGMVMTEPSGQTTTWSSLSLNGKNYFADQAQPAGAGSLQSSRSQSYDANGNIASRDNFNGTRSCYLNDLVRNVATAAVAGLSPGQNCAAVTTTNAGLPAGAVKTSTQWHPDWSLPIRVATPGQITTSVYNGQPDPLNANAVASCAPTAARLLDGQPIAALCKRVTQATTDADGHLGFSATRQAGTLDTVQTWTYDVDGRVLSSTDSDTDTTPTRPPWRTTPRRTRTTSVGT
ncbi:hypothetical protein [Rhizobacter sp. Root16D2]|uniref:hypothetical protein n=1 Tax=Rhizobacter sp. Root16D2 TaxID=1736479 RepID=UPI001F15E679|nr:hypothetical protein [Rhizobacter sp. Root16D2]